MMVAVISNSLWDRLGGQERVRALLESAAQNPRGPYLLAGPPGVGKSDAARVLAAAILCDKACGECGICTRVLSGLHPDVHIHHPEGFTYPVDMIREVVASSAQTPLEASRRVIIIEEADRIVERSQNALLKALEEPGASVTWILVADVLDVFLPTILSRCHLVEFTPVPEEHVRDLLLKRFELTDSEAGDLTRMARGNLEQAIALASSEVARRIRILAIETATRSSSLAWALGQTEEVQQLAGEARQEVAEAQAVELSALEDALGKGRGTAGARKKTTDRHKRELRRTETEVYLDFLGWIGTAFRDLAAASSGSDAESLVNRDRAGEILEASQTKPAIFWLNLAEKASEARIRILENANAAMVIESVVLRLAE